MKRKDLSWALYVGLSAAQWALAAVLLVRGGWAEHTMSSFLIGWGSLGFYFAATGPWVGARDISNPDG